MGGPGPKQKDNEHQSNIVTWQNLLAHCTRAFDASEKWLMKTIDKNRSSSSRATGSATEPVTSKKRKAVDQVQMAGPDRVIKQE